jgi:hypothetical protein
MVPARGVIVASRPREWLGIHEVQRAFEAGRVRLTETQVSTVYTPCVHPLPRLLLVDPPQRSADVIASRGHARCSVRVGAGAGAAGDDVCEGVQGGTACV